jgi:putative flavoprotein involved in K+ transport
MTETPETPQDRSPERAAELATRWLGSLADVLASGEVGRLGELFTDDASWRDIVALTRDIRSVTGTEAMAEMLKRAVDQVRPESLRLYDGWGPTFMPRVERVEAFFSFETALGEGEGVARIDVTGGVPRAWTLFTAQAALRDHPERRGKNRPYDLDFAAHFGAPNWADERAVERAYLDREPAVLVVGAGQAGLSVAARLRAIGVDTLVIERRNRVGDNWRDRYHSLWLHNEVDMNHLPYLPFPETWPTYIPKDKMGFWLEAYAEAMDLNVWTGTELATARWDAADGRWTVELTGPAGDGATRTVRPVHVVMASGISGEPRRPDIPGLADFRGPVLHSSEFLGAEPYRGQRVVVFGVANSGSDVAQDLQAHGAQVTMVQRGSITVVSHSPGSVMLNALYTRGLPTHVADLINIASPGPASFDAHRAMTRRVRTVDEDLIARLNAAGFKTDYGHDETGFGMKYYRTGGGHYLNVGCAELIISGAVALRQYEDVDRVVPDGVRLTSGEVVPADLVVLATGYHGLSAEVARHFGDDVAQRVGEVWGLDDEGELNNMWRPTAQPGLWFTAGGLYQCRVYSKYLALQIAADELGLERPAAG